MTAQKLRGRWMAAVAAVTLCLGAGAAHAHGGNVYWSVGVSSPGVHVGVASAPPMVVYPPVMMAPPPVAYMPARPVAYLPPAYYGPPPGWRHHHHHGGGREYGREHGRGGWYR